MTLATALVTEHINTLVDDNQKWTTLIHDDIVWELPYAPSLGHPVRLEGRDAVLRHADWFANAVTNFSFFDVRVIGTPDLDQAVAIARAEGQIRATGRTYSQEYVIFLTAKDGRISHLREYFDPVQAAYALDAPIVGVPARSI